MRPLPLALPLLGALLAIVPLGAETLGEAAARETARRQQGVARKAPVYTEGELASAGGASGTFSAMTGPAQKKATPPKGLPPSVIPLDAPPEEATEDAPARRGGRTESEWRSAAALIQEEIRLATSEVKELAKTPGGITVPKLTCAEGPQCAFPTEGASPYQRLAVARYRLKYAEDALSDLEDKARQLSVPPGWLRER